MDDVAQSTSASLLGGARRLGALVEQLEAPAPADQHALPAEHVGLLRVDMRVRRGPAIVDFGVDFVVAEAGLRYHQPARFDDELRIEIAVARLGTTSVTTSYRVLRDAEFLVEGTLRHVLVTLTGRGGREPGAKTAIPGWMRERLAPYLD